jgi:hypothetical protein
MDKNITQKRLELINQEGDEPIKLKIEDLINKEGLSAGTLVKITIPVH